MDSSQELTHFRAARHDLYDDGTHVRIEPRTDAIICRDDRGVALTQHARGELFLDSTVALSSDDVAVGSGAFRDGID